MQNALYTGRMADVQSVQGYSCPVGVQKQHIQPFDILQLLFGKGEGFPAQHCRRKLPGGHQAFDGAGRNGIEGQRQHDAADVLGGLEGIQDTDGDPLRLIEGIVQDDIGHHLMQKCGAGVEIPAVLIVVKGKRVQSQPGEMKAATVFPN